MDPRRSLMAGGIYLICVLGVVFSSAAAIWVGGIARQNVLEQHVRRLALETDQLSSDLSEALAARTSAVSTVGRLFGGDEREDMTRDLGHSYEALAATYPQLDWVAIADATGMIVRSDGRWREGTRVDGSQWFLGGSKGPWLGVIEESSDSAGLPVPGGRSNTGALGDLALPVHDRDGRLIGVIAAHLSWRRTPDHSERLTDETDPPLQTDAYVLDGADVVLVGPARSRGQPWSGVQMGGNQRDVSRSHPPVAPAYPLFERLSDGRHVLVSRSRVNTPRDLAPLGLQVLLSEPNGRVYRRANAVTQKILWASLLLGVTIALIGALGIRQLTRRLQRLSLSVASVRRNEAANVDVPDGIDEISQLGTAFSHLIDDLARERRDLQTLAGELERRVAVRTREVERLAEESRYAPVVRERLKLARALHDTLAHSMMAIISEIRFIRRLQTHEPAAVPDELGRAEELARQGLQEARSAIAQMRATTVREAGLGPTLSREVEQFTNRTGLAGQFKSDSEAERFGDERSEVLLRMAQEALRNVDRHARATHVNVTLEIHSGTRLVLTIEDDGVGFEPAAPREGHFGLIGLHEQAESIGAHLRIDSESKLGTRICISLPISPIVFESAATECSGNESIQPRTHGDFGA